MITSDRHTRAVLGGYLGLLGCVTVLALGGCTTIISGGKATGEAPGIRYYLPAPHVVLNPQPDGTVKVEVKYLPDPNNSYTLNVGSYFSNATFDVTLVDGILTKVSLDADSTAVGSKAISAATELEKQKMAAEQKEKEAEKTKKDKKKAEIKAAAEAVRAQEEKVALLEGKLKFYDDNANGFDAAELKKLKLDLNSRLSEERIKLEQLRNRLGLVRSGDNAGNNPRDAFLDPGNRDPDLKEAYGPVLFRVLPTPNGGVKLVALEGQKTYQTSTSAVQPAKPEGPLTFSPSTAIVKKDATDRDIVFVFSKSIRDIDEKDTRLVRPTDGVKEPPILSGNQLTISLEGPEAKLMRIVLPKSLPAGRYRLDVVLRVRGSEERQQKSLPIDWLAE